MSAPSRSRLLLIGLVVLLLLAIAEVTVRARSSVFPPPQRWVGPEMPLKEQQIEELERRGGASAIFLGSSTTDVSFDPSEMREGSDGRPVYNASTGAASLQMIATWARLVAVPRLRPDVAVLGVVSREFNPNDPEQQLLDRQFFEAPAVRELQRTENTFEKAERRIEQVSALFKYRTFIRQPRYFETIVGLKAAPSRGEYGEYVAPDGQYQDFLERPYSPQSHVFSGGALKGFEIGDGPIATMRRLLSFLNANTDRVIVVNMPVTTDYIDLHPDKKDDYDGFTRMLEQETDRAGVEYIDPGIWPKRYFADAGHLNARGSARITELLDDAIRAGRSESVARRAP